MERVDAVVIGAGVVGLASARALARAGHEVLVLEAEARFGSGISSRSSEVIHAGLYYPPGSLKARLCLAGREALVRYCEARGIAHRCCGKLIVATTAGQLAGLEAIARNARESGAAPLQSLEGPALERLEPALRAVAALHCAGTGIVDSHALMLALLADAERAGATLACRAPVAALRVAAQGIEIETGEGGALRLLARRVVNAAGLGAIPLARRIEGLPAATVPRAWFAKGNYFVLQGHAPFRHLIYPLPEPAGLGIHLTLDLAGQARFGPDVEWIEVPSYTVERSRRAAFAESVRRYWPALPEERLVPGYAGVRPKIAGPQEPAADFRIDGPETHGVTGLVNLFGIESPGLTASLAIAEQVALRLR